MARLKVCKSTLQVDPGSFFFRAFQKHPPKNNVFCFCVHIPEFFLSMKVLDLSQLQYDRNPKQQSVGVHGRHYVGAINWWNAKSFA